MSTSWSVIYFMCHELFMHTSVYQYYIWVIIISWWFFLSRHKHSVIIQVNTSFNSISLAVSTAKSQVICITQAVTERLCVTSCITQAVTERLCDTRDDECNPNLTMSLLVQLYLFAIVLLSQRSAHPTINCWEIRN